jgi:DedD protein
VKPEAAKSRSAGARCRQSQCHRSRAPAKALLEGKPAESAERIVVQVGAFADAARAREVRLTLERAGLKTYTHVAETSEGKRIRVRVGPFASRAEADKAAARVKALGLPAAILTL